MATYTLSEAAHQFDCIENELDFFVNLLELLNDHCGRELDSLDPKDPISVQIVLSRRELAETLYVDLLYRLGDLIKKAHEARSSCFEQLQQEVA